MFRSKSKEKLPLTSCAVANVLLESISFITVADVSNTLPMNTIVVKIAM
ncbi:MAG: hypothetical protein ACUZ8O_05490 [Candidatus Anammoxibacter sp.]